MIRIVVTTREGVEQVVEGQEGNSLMEALRNGGLDEVLALCGGCCSCATCHVYVDPSAIELLPPISQDEEELLDGSLHRRDVSRLSCQIPCSPELDGLRVTVAPED